MRGKGGVDLEQLTRGKIRGWFSGSVRNHRWKFDDDDDDDDGDDDDDEIVIAGDDDYDLVAAVRGVSGFAKSRDFNRDTI